MAVTTLVDRSFIFDLPNNRTPSVHFSTMIALADGSACRRWPGIETERAQRRWLVEHGCRWGRASALARHAADHIAGLSAPLQRTT